MCQLKSFVDAQEAKTAPPLGPLLAQFQLDMMKVCKELNEKTKHYESGVPLPVKINIDEAKNYEIVLGGPTLQFLYDQLLFEGNRTLSLCLFYDWVKLYALYHNLPVSSQLVTQALSTLSSMKGSRIKW